MTNGKRFSVGVGSYLDGPPPDGGERAHFTRARQHVKKVARGSRKRYFATMPVPQWRKIPHATWEARIRALSTSRQIRAHVACIAWWDLALHKAVPPDWMRDLRDEYNERAKEDRDRLADALTAAGYPPDFARRRAFKDVLSGYVRKKRKPDEGEGDE